MKEVQKVLDELEQVRPEKLTGEAKRLFEAIMKIADERDEFEYKYNRAIEDLVKLEKERQADKEKIKELESDKEIKDKMIDDMVNWIYELFKARPGTVSKAFNYEVCISDDCDNINREVNCDYCIKQYFENLAKESGEKDEDNRIIE